MMDRRLFVAGLGSGLALPGIIRAEAASPRLQAKGNRLWFGAKAVRLRGVAMHSPLDRLSWGRTTADYATVARLWRANTVRITAMPGSWITSRAAMTAALEADVRAALAQDLFVIIDWHPVGWPDGRYERGDYPGGDIELSSAMGPARAFWAYAAKRFGGDGRIAFELFNEPTGFGVAGSDAVRWRKLKPHLAELLAIVRRSSPNLVLATGEAAIAVAPIAADPLKDPNLAYAWHVYPNQGGPESWARHLGSLAATRPVVVTEWGFDPDSADPVVHGSVESFGAPFMAFVNQRGLHWTAWVWHALYGPRLLGGAGPTPDQDDWCGPSKFGQFVLGQLGAGAPAC